MVTHLQEIQEANRRGQTEISETLRKVDENQTRIAEMLMEMNHKGKGPESYANKETSGSHGGNRYQQEYIPYHHSEGSHGGGAPQGQTGCRTTPVPYFPSFTEEPTQSDHPDEFEDQFDQYVREYNSLSPPVQRQITLDQFCGLKFRSKPRLYHRNNYELERRAGKMEIPYFDGSAKLTAQVWVQKLDTYLQLNPMREMDAINFATM